MLKIGLGVERLVFFSFLFVVMLHVLSCVWVITGDLAYEDILAAQAAGKTSTEDSWISPYKGTDFTTGMLYLTSFYFTTTTVTTVGYGDISG